MVSISVTPMILKHRLNKEGKSPLVIRIYLNREPVAYENIKQKVKPMHWDEVKREVKKDCPNAILINALISNRVAELQNVFLEKQLLKVTLNRERIIKIMQGVQDQDFDEFCNQQIDLWINKFSKGTIRTYKSELTKLEKFRSILSFSDIDVDFLQQYEAYMRQQLSNHSNTVWRTFKFIYKIFNTAEKIGGIIASNPFKSFDRGKYQQGMRSYLTIEDCAKMRMLR